ncbi:MAG TPA: MBL fold metallo-hydrolase [Vicinamibacteria bacterium]|nr:MBL fold metallo-hydrolase [Vicinamibacteria bacterium]
MESYNAAPDIEVITSNFPLPGFGFVPINAFVLKGAEPILVDTGAGVESKEFLRVLRSILDPSELRWLWLTHPDHDHTGSLQPLLAENPRLRIITSFLSVGILSLTAPLPLDRVHLLNPGEVLTVGDRRLHAIRPPAFDSPATTGFYDDKSGVLVSSDCFGALLSRPAQNAAELSQKELREGQIFWATLDSPWLHKAETGAFAKDLDLVRKMDPTMILSSHLPAARGDMAERLLGTLAGAQSAQPFVAPNQAALEQMLAAQ